MDIVSRIKIFMNYLGIANSQFADTCKIPRPTISQVLNGRNKKISDELISKIHEAYPQLSVLWLMFGEGEMVQDANIKISEPQTETNLGFDDTHRAVTETFSDRIDFDSPEIGDVTNKNIQTDTLPDPLKATEFASSLPKESAETAQGTITFSTDASKEIVNILVFYSDGRFQQFVPMKN
ncbi:MAG: helix-turn-helix domain-containing protein [Muribaculaceae bacterium]